MKKIIIALVVTLAVTGVYFGFPWYQQYKFIESVTPHIKKTSLLVTRGVQYETDDTRITYKEVLEKLESDISEIDKIILEVQTLTAPNNKEFSDSVLVYLKKSQNLLRVLKEKHQNILALNVYRNRYERVSNRIKNNEYVSTDTRVDLAVDSAILPANVTLSLKEVVKATENLKDASAKIAVYLQSDVLVDPIILHGLIKSYGG